MGVRGEEGVRVVLEVECDEVTGHGRHVNVGDGHGLVPLFAVSVGGGVTGVTEPVGSLAKHGFAAGGFGVDGPVGVAVVGEAVALTGGLEGLLAHLTWRTAVDVRGQSREDRGLDVEVHFGVAPVVRGDDDVEGVLGIERASTEVFDAFNGGVVDVERRQVAHGVVVEVLLVPRVVGQHRRDTVGRVVHQVRGDRRGVFLTGRKRVGRQIDGGLRLLWIGKEGRVLLVDGQVVHGEAVVSLPVLVVVVGGGAFKAGAEAEADVHGLTGPR